jgi:hypothetical protein
MIINTSHLYIFGKDDLGFIIYENKKLIKFTNFHHVYNSEAFFYNTILQKNNFVINKIKFQNSIEKSYVHECQIRGFLHNVELLQTYLIQYTNQNLFGNEKQTQLFQKKIIKNIQI